MAERVIDLKGALAVKQSRGRAGARFAIEVTSPDLVVTFDDKRIAGDMATAIAEQWTENFLNGLDWNGRPLPPVSGATIKRREARKRQMQAGKHTPGFLRRFTTQKLGQFWPTGQYGGNRLVGVESGLLAKSWKAAPEGAGWMVFVAGVRGLVDRLGSSALQRVFNLIGPPTAEAARQPRVQKVLKEMPARVFMSAAKRTLIWQNVQQGAAEFIGESP